MIAYPDTSFLWAIYVQQSNSAAAAGYAAQMAEPLQVTGLLRYEFRQSLRFQTWRNAGNPREGISLPDANAALAQFEMDLQTGVANLVPCSFHDVLARSDQLSERHTVGHGHRAFDILHVATALVLEAREFLTFDDNQRRLAASVGLSLAP